MNSSEKFFAGESISSQNITVLMFIFFAALANILPNCPPPIIPTIGLTILIRLLFY